jgi:hypothetical protein
VPPYNIKPFSHASVLSVLEGDFYGMDRGGRVQLKAVFAFYAPQAILRAIRPRGRRGYRGMVQFLNPGVGVELQDGVWGFFWWPKGALPDAAARSHQDLKGTSFSLIPRNPWGRGSLCGRGVR